MPKFILAAFALFITSGISFSQIDLPSTVVAEQLTNPESNLKIWIYRPKTAGAEKLPCILIAPAGSRMFHGMDMADGDSPEHIPYAEAGFVVIAYEVSGPLDDSETNQETIDAITSFKEAKGGVTDGLQALDLALKKYPIIDSERIYAAGHSSAAVVALALAQSSEKIRAAIAYAPAPDVVKHLSKEFIGEIDGIIPGFAAFVSEYSPLQNVQKIKCPVFLFNAKDDSLVSPQSIDSYAEALKKAGVTLTQKTVETGEHYDSMIDVGIPSGIEWLKSLK